MTSVTSWSRVLPVNAHPTNVDFFTFPSGDPAISTSWTVFGDLATAVTAGDITIFTTVNFTNLNGGASQTFGFPSVTARYIGERVNSAIYPHPSNFQFSEIAFEGELTIVPEPTTLLLLGTGLAIAAYRRRRKVRR